MSEKSDSLIITEFLVYLQNNDVWLTKPIYDEIPVKLDHDQVFKIRDDFIRLSR